MKKTLMIYLFQLLYAGLCLGQITPEWVKSYNSAGNSQDFGYSLVTDSKNNVVVSGTTQTLNTGEDFITIKYSPEGNRLWARQFADTVLSQETCFINAVDRRDNIYTGGINTELNGWNYAIVKYDESGNVKWINKDFFQTSQLGYLNSIATDELLNVYYAASAPGFGTELVKIDSNGITKWKRTFRGSGYGPAVCAFDNSTNSVVVLSIITDSAYAIRIAKYSNNGDSLWCNFISDYETYGDFLPKDLCIINSSVFLTASNNSAILTVKYLANGSLSWIKIYDQYDIVIAQSVIPAGENSLYVGGIAGNSNTDFLLLKYNYDGDLLWDRVFNSGNNDDLYDICSDENNNVYASGISDNGCSTVKFSSNGTFLWDHIYHISPTETSWGFSNGCADNSLYVTGYGIGNGSGCDIITLKYNTLIGINQTSSEVPQHFSLSQNYPNPFNPTTNFEFRIADFGFVNLTIYDVTGRKVTTLVNGNLKPGTYKADWDASNYVSGVYFYKLSSGSFTETRKMILIK